MGNNTLETILGGIGRKEQVNQYKEALVGDILPRNANGEVEALAANLGNESVPFSGVTVKGPVSVLGIKKSQTVTTSQTFSFPVDAYCKMAEIYSDGGVGANGVFSGNSNDGSHSGGGGGGGCSIIVVDLDKQSEITVTKTSEKTSISSSTLSEISAISGGGGTGTSGGGGGACLIPTTELCRILFFCNGGNGGSGGTSIWIGGNSATANNGTNGNRGDINVGGSGGIAAAGANGSVTGGGGGGGSPAAKVAGYSGGNGGSLSGRLGGVVFTWKERE